MRARRLPATVGAVLLLAPALTLASQSGTHAEHHAPGLGDLLFPAVNFTIFATIFVVYVVPAMREYLRKRRAEIVAAVADSRAALTTAEGRLADAKARLAGIDAEGESIRVDLFESATRQAARIRREADATGKRRLEDAAVLAEQERRRALGAIRAEIATAATRIAEERIRGALGPDDQRGFVRAFLTEAAER